MADLTALALICSLTPSPAPSSSELMARHVLAELQNHGVSGTSLRVVDHNVMPGVQTDMGDGDAWPMIRDRILAADILILATPIWMGHPSSITQRVIERLQTVDYKDLDKVPEKVAATTSGAARNAAHLARSLSQAPYPAE